MYGFKYVLRDLQRELLDHARADGIPFTIDPEDFVVVQSKDETRLEAIWIEIDRRILVECWYFSTGRLDAYRREHDVNLARGVPFIESETISDLPLHSRARPGLPSVRHSYRLAIRNESSLPKGQRPWDRK